MKLSFRLYALPFFLLALAGCASQGKPPPTISLDEPVQAQPLPEPPKPVVPGASRVAVKNGDLRMPRTAYST